jgi:hypothetical protein
VSQRMRTVIWYPVFTFQLCVLYQRTSEEINFCRKKDFSAFHMSLSNFARLKLELGLEKQNVNL